MPIAQDDFWNCFAELLRQHLESTIRQTEYSLHTPWSHFMVHHLLPDVARSLGFDSAQLPCPVGWEWCRVDFSTFSFQPSLDAIDSNKNWDWELAIEHENNWKTWPHEFVKLAHIVCGLKVIISYYRTLTELDQEMEKATQLYRCRSYKQPNDNWLLIFGPTAISDGDFVAFKFDGKDLVKMPDRPIFRAIGNGP